MNKYSQYSQMCKNVLDSSMGTLYNTDMISEEVIHLTKELHIFTDLDFENADALLHYMGGQLQQTGCVRETYPQAVVDREKEYPTGLPTENIKVAIPHTGAAHVLRQAVAVATLKKPVLFYSIEQDGEQLPVEIVFMLALSDSDAHMDLLQAVMKMIQDDSFLQQLKATQDHRQIADLVEKKLASV
mgnify:FL=1